MICTLLFCVVTVFIGCSESAPIPWKSGKFPSNFPGIGNGVNPYFLYNWFMRLLKSEALNSFMNSFSRGQTQSAITPSTTSDNASRPTEGVRNGDRGSTDTTLVVVRDQNPVAPSITSPTTLKPLSAENEGIPIVILDDENNGRQTDRITNDTSAGSTPKPSTENSTLQIVRDTFQEDAKPEISSGSNVQKQSDNIEQTAIESSSDLTIVRDTDNIEQNGDTADIKMVRDSSDNEDMTSVRTESSTKPGLLILQPHQLRGFFFKRNR